MPKTCTTSMGKKCRQQLSKSKDKTLERAFLATISAKPLENLAFQEEYKREYAISCSTQPIYHDKGKSYGNGSKISFNNDHGLSKLWQFH